MVRINLINPRKLSDQHLIAEYLEIMMLVGYVKSYPCLTGVPESYRLGEGHIKFFKDKLLYLKNRHELIKQEMKKRGFVTNKNLSLAGFGKKYCNDWKPCSCDFELIKCRIKTKIKMRPNFYRYCGEYKGGKFFIDLLR